MRCTWPPTRAGVRYSTVALGNTLDVVTGTYLPGAILASETAGRSWEARVNGLPQNVSSSTNQTAKYEVVRVSPSNPNVLFTSNTSWTDAGLFISTDGGKRWQRTANQGLDKAYPAGSSMEVATIAPQDENIILAAGASYILRTTDGGANWDDATSVRPTPGAATWRGRGYSGLVTKDFAFHPTRSNVSAFAAMDAGNCWVSTDDRFSWHERSGDLPTWGGGNGLSFTGSTSLFVTLGQNNFGGIARSSDLGKSWTILHGSARGLPDKGFSGKAYKIHAAPQDSSQVWTVVNGKLYHSDNYGDDWTVVFQEAEVNHFDVVGEELFIATNQGVYRGTDRTFELFADPGFEVTFCLFDASSGSLYTCGWRRNGGGLWRWDGESWSLLIDDQYVSSFAIHPLDPEEIVALTGDDPYHDETFATGVYFTEDGGQNWTRENSGLAMLRGGVIKYNPHNPNELVLGTGGRGFFAGTKSSTTRTVNDGTILQAEDYDRGGQNVGYYDRTPDQNRGGAYRDEGVDIKEFAPGEYYVGWIQSGEWLAYTLEVTAGKYDIAVRMASPNDDRTLRLMLDGQTWGTVDCPNSSTSFNDFKTATLSGVDLPAGRHKLRLEMVDGSFNVDKLAFSLTPIDPTETIPVDQVISLRSLSTGRFVTANHNEVEGPLTAAWATEVQSWERFELTLAQDGRVALRSTANGAFVATENNLTNKMLRANRGAVGSWEQYDWINNDDDGTISLKAYANGQYVTVTAGGALQATASTISTATKFNWASLEDLVATRAQDNQSIAREQTWEIDPFEVYPNPASEELVVRGAEDYRVIIYDAAGRQLLERAHLNGTVRLGIGALPPSIYLIKLSDRLHERVLRIVIE